jgi:valyl-tRNA synthetase
MWQESSLYRFDPDSVRASKKGVYSIDTPPPTVSGMIHMGHVFSYVQAEVIARYHRMLGEEVFYPFCFDDNGLPSERFTEREKGVKARDLSREDFVRLCLEVTKGAEAGFRELWTRMGFSCDWDEIYTTIDPWVQGLSQRSFLELYRSGRAYRKSTPSLWCTECHTGVAQAESEDEELPSVFYDLEFGTESGDRIPIATTRPELIPACVAVFVHPEDGRWSDLIGNRAVVPIFGHAVPIHGDSRVDIEKGSGVVMCCTFGDTTDIEWWDEFGLDQRIVIDRYGRMNSLATFLEGLDTSAARKEIVGRLKEAGYLKKGEEIVHSVNVHERCHTPLEYLVQPQWFIRVLDLKDELLERGRSISWHPDYFRTRFEHWVENLRWDWSVSRQRYYGVPFPLWYCKECGEPVLADDDQLPVDPLVDTPGSPCGKCGSSGDFEPEPDVLDTWATSSMTPLINAKWNEDGERRYMIPMTMRPQAHDIIRTWAFYTVVKSHLHESDVPWKHIMISGHALNPSREKMSKSKGNVAGDPIAALEVYSADELRYWACSSKLGTDVVFSEEILGLGRRLVTKMWNATRFASGHLEDFDPKAGEGADPHPFDIWLRARLEATVKRATSGMTDYDYFTCLRETETFFWSGLCDNYLEIAKRRLYGDDPAQRAAAQRALYDALYTSLRLFAPILVHITDELYQLVFRQHEGHASIHVSPWPELTAPDADPETLRLGELALLIIEDARRYKSENNLSMAAPLDKISVICAESDLEGLRAFEPDLIGVTRAAEIDWSTSDSEDLEIRVENRLPAE